MRRGATLVEALLATVLALMALSAVLMILFSVRKMESAGDLAGALQEASLAMAVIQEDLSQAVQKPDPSVDTAVQVSKKSVQLLRGVLKDDGSIDAKRVVYEKEATAGGNFRLLRKYDSERGFLPGVYRSLRFDQLEGAGGPFVRVTLHLAVTDSSIPVGQSASGLQEAVLTSLVRIQGPEMVGSRAFGWSFMSLLKLIPWLPF